MLPLTNFEPNIMKTIKIKLFSPAEYLKKKKKLFNYTCSCFDTKNVSYYAFEKKIKCDGQIPLLFPFRWSLLVANMYSSSVQLHVIDKKMICDMEPERCRLVHIYMHASVLPVNVPGICTCILKDVELHY